MPSFGNKSMTNLLTCERDLQTVLHEAIKIVDFSVVFGHRSPELQYSLWEKGRNGRGEVTNVSEVVTYRDGYKKKSNHNYEPSRAVDIIPYPGGWKDKEGFHYIAGVIASISRRLLKEGRITKPIKWGGHWKTLIDLPHYEI